MEKLFQRIGILIHVLSRRQQKLRFFDEVFGDVKVLRSSVEPPTTDGLFPKFLTTNMIFETYLS